MKLIKEEFLKIFSDIEIGNKIYNQLKLSMDYGIITCSEYFFTPNIWKKLPNQFGNILVKSFGYDRRQICFYPKNELPFFNYKLLKIEVLNKFKEYKHKDFLGSIMGLNIKREFIGDIFISETNIAYIYVSDIIYEYILNNLIEIGKNKCKITIAEDRKFEYSYSTMNITITSNRLDNFVSNITNLSRNETIMLIENGLVLLDYEKCLKKDKILEKDNIISIRKYGKYKIFEENGKSKKRKNRWLIKKYE